jgi:hypothetical protein
MHSLFNRSGELVAYLHQNAIVHPDTFEVLGVVLGNCVFGSQAKVLGKIVHDKVYAVTGEMLAKADTLTLSLPQRFNVKKCISQSWQLLMRIKDHACPWINEKETWSKSSLAEFLYA